ncbi:MAG TPA: preprotein translocase subunit SecE [Ruminiclostridium sp.]|jgi:preprotein translocase subunit SecE|nr:preprotein translocase subunit SecE [Clostridiaceae bacterium]HAA25738.1 preprotein translocase subunit SecE [Ruminiclostridium sp.]
MAEQSKKPNIFQRLARFTKEVRSELKKVIWPSKNQVINNTLIVLITCLIIGGIIWILDFLLSQLYTLVFV